MGTARAKSYLDIAGRPLVLRTLDRMFASPRIENVILVVSAADFERCQTMLRSDPALKDRAWILQTGGVTRQESARRGLEKIPGAADLIAIHDAARPFVSVELIERCLDAAAAHGAAVPGLPARDTIKIVSPECLIEATPDRARLREIQTPQVFARDLILTAHAKAARDRIECTDDAMVVERFGKPVFVVEGETTNIKITVPEDLWFAEALLRQGQVV